MNWLEAIAVVVAIIGIILTIVESRTCWLANILASALYLKVFYHSNLLGQMFLQLLYIVVGVAGYVHWRDKNQVKIKRLDRFVLSSMILASILIGFLIHRILEGVLWADASLTIGGVVGAYLTARKFIENWVLWAIINIVSIALFTYQGLYLTAALYLLYAALSFIGLKRWSRELSHLDSLHSGSATER